MKRLLLTLTLLLPMPALAQEQPALTAKIVSNNLQPFIGKKFDGDVTIAGVTSEGNTLIIVVDAASGWGDVPRSSATDLFLSGFCSKPAAAAYFKGNLLRVDTLERGANLLKGSPVNSCPPAAQ
jgi:hypothetical protein